MANQQAPHALANGDEKLSLEQLQRLRETAVKEQNEINAELLRATANLAAIDAAIDKHLLYEVFARTRTSVGDRGVDDIVWGENKRHSLGKFTTFEQAHEMIRRDKSPWPFLDLEFGDNKEYLHRYEIVARTGEQKRYEVHPDTRDTFALLKKT